MPQKLKKGTPIPPPAGGPKPKYGFETLAVGEALKFPRDDFPRAVNAAIKYGQYHGMTFVSRSKQLTIWRTK